MMQIKQNESQKLIQDKKTVEWLILNTSVSVFDPVEFTGYQRKIDEKHCEKIVNYLEKEFFLPTSIICAVTDKYDKLAKLRIVDGQHRVHAMRLLKETNPIRYKQIKDKELSVIIMENPRENTEIDAFITINKTSKKVDTSLAYVLKSKLNKNSDSSNLTISKLEYLSVELAYRLNSQESNSIWRNKILYEGNPKDTSQLISLNAFVKSTRGLLGCLERKKLIKIEWTNSEEIDECLEQILGFVVFIWEVISDKWSNLFYNNPNDLRIIQGAIGYSALNKVICRIIGEMEYSQNMVDIKKVLKNRLNMISIDNDFWYPGGYFSRFSSENGYNIVANELLERMG